MMEIRQEDLQGQWMTTETILRGFFCPHNPKLAFYFWGNHVTIDWPKSMIVEYTIEDNNGLTKLVKDADGKTILEIWQIMDRNFSSLIISYKNQKYHIVKK